MILHQISTKVASEKHLWYTAVVDYKFLSPCQTMQSGNPGSNLDTGIQTAPLKPFILCFISFYVPHADLGNNLQVDSDREHHI